MLRKFSKIWPVFTLALCLAACAKNADMMGMGAGSGAATTIDNSVGGDNGAGGNAATKKDDSGSGDQGKDDNGGKDTQGPGGVVVAHAPGNDTTVQGPVYDFPHHPKYRMHACASVVSANIPLGTFKIRIKGYIRKLVSNISGEYEPCCTARVMRIRYNAAIKEMLPVYKYYDLPLTQNNGQDGYFDTKEDLVVSSDPDFSFYWKDPDNNPSRSVNDCSGKQCVATLLQVVTGEAIDNFNIDFNSDFIGGIPNCDSQPIDGELRSPIKSGILQESP